MDTNPSTTVYCCEPICKILIHLFGITFAHNYPDKQPQDMMILLFIAIALFVYMCYVLIKPDKF